METINPTADRKKNRDECMKIILDYGPDDKTKKASGSRQYAGRFKKKQNKKFVGYIDGSTPNGVRLMEIMRRKISNGVTGFRFEMVEPESRSKTLTREQQIEQAKKTLARLEGTKPGAKK